MGITFILSQNWAIINPKPLTEFRANNTILFFIKQFLSQERFDILLMLHDAVSYQRSISTDIYKSFPSSYFLNCDHKSKRLDHILENSQKNDHMFY